MMDSMSASLGQMDQHVGQPGVFDAHIAGGHGPGQLVRAAPGNRSRGPSCRTDGGGWRSVSSASASSSASVAEMDPFPARQQLLLVSGQDGGSPRAMNSTCSATSSRPSETCELIRTAFSPSPTKARSVSNRKRRLASSSPAAGSSSNSRSGWWARARASEKRVFCPVERRWNFLSGEIRKRSSSP